MFPRFGWYYGILGLIVQVTLVVFAIRSYRAQRTRSGLMLLLALICNAIAASSWYTVAFVEGLFWGSHATRHVRLVFADSRYYLQQTFQMLFAALMIAILLSFLRERRLGGSPNI
jgi:hypothetical protein